MMTTRERERRSASTEQPPSFHKCSTANRKPATMEPVRHDPSNLNFISRCLQREPLIGGGQPLSRLSFTLSSGNIPECDVQRAIRRCDWLEKSYFCMSSV